MQDLQSADLKAMRAADCAESRVCGAAGGGVQEAAGEGGRGQARGGHGPHGRHHGHRYACRPPSSHCSRIMHAIVLQQEYWLGSASGSPRQACCNALPAGNEQRTLFSGPEHRLAQLWPQDWVQELPCPGKESSRCCGAGAGLLDAGGRNVTVGLRSASGYFRRTSCVGMMLFLQYWYWYPLSYCVSLALQPSALVGLNADLKLPKMQVRPLLTDPLSCNRSSCPGSSATVGQRQGSEAADHSDAVRHSCSLPYAFQSVQIFGGFACESSSRCCHVDCRASS